MSRQCENCRFFWKPPKGDPRCRRYPPETVAVAEWLAIHIRLPEVDPQFWCGEWQAKEPPE